MDNTNNKRWKVTTSGGDECLVPSVCFVIPAQDPLAIDAAERLNRQYYKIESLWRRQLKTTYDRILELIKKTENPDNVHSMGREGREDFRKKLNELAENFLQISRHAHCLLSDGTPERQRLLKRLEKKIKDVIEKVLGGQFYRDDLDLDDSLPEWMTDTSKNSIFDFFDDLPCRFYDLDFFLLAAGNEDSRG